jgi:hypothetical protein
VTGCGENFLVNGKGEVRAVSKQQLGPYLQRKDVLVFSLEAGSPLSCRHPAFIRRSPQSKFGSLQRPPVLTIKAIQRSRQIVFDRDDG